ncbi:MAG: hypothetical protein LAT84_05390 [Balneolia bacterium]|nr:hypothetical protein [Balneolia bacterium]
MKYDDTELKQIIGRAIELQRNAGELEAEASEISRGSFTEAEIEEIARDSGLSSKFLKQSLAEYKGIPLEEAFFIDTFEKNHIEIMGFVEGRLDQRAWAEIKALAEKEFKTKGKGKGKVVKLDKGMRWEKDTSAAAKFTSGFSPEFMEVTESAGRLKVRIRRKVKLRRFPEIPAWMCVIGVVLMVRIMLFDELIGGLFTGILFGAFALLFFNWAAKLKAKSRVKLRDLMESVQAVLTRANTDMGYSAQAEQTAHIAVPTDEDSGTEREAEPGRLENKLRS